MTKRGRNKEFRKSMEDKVKSGDRRV